MGSGLAAIIFHHIKAKCNYQTYEQNADCRF